MTITTRHLYAVLALCAALLAMTYDPREQADGTVKSTMEKAK